VLWISRFSDEESNITSLISNNKVSIFSQDTDEETAANSLEPYQLDTNDSNMDENESSSDEELVRSYPMI